MVQGCHSGSVSCMGCTQCGHRPPHTPTPSPTGMGHCSILAALEATAPQPWDIAGLLATFSGGALCQGSRAGNAAQLVQQAAPAPYAQRATASPELAGSRASSSPGFGDLSESKDIVQDPGSGSAGTPQLQDHSWVQGC